MIHTQNPRTWDAEAGGLPWVPGQTWATGVSSPVLQKALTIKAGDVGQMVELLPSRCGARGWFTEPREPSMVAYTCHPALRRWRWGQENEEFKVIFEYVLSLNSAWGGSGGGGRIDSQLKPRKNAVLPWVVKFWISDWGGGSRSLMNSILDCYTVFYEKSFRWLEKRKSLEADLYKYSEWIFFL